MNFLFLVQDFNVAKCVPRFQFAPRRNITDILREGDIPDERTIEEYVGAPKITLNPSSVTDSKPLGNQLSLIFKPMQF